MNFQNKKIKEINIDTKTPNSQLPTSTEFSSNIKSSSST